MSEPIEIPKRKPRATKKALDIEAMEEKQLKLEQALKPKRVSRASALPTTPCEHEQGTASKRFDEETIINKIIEKLKIPKIEQERMHGEKTQTLTITPETPKMPTQSLTSTETTPILKKKKFIC
jgi:hypothetical protein